MRLTFKHNVRKGGPGSGHFGHAGRPGQVGGSSSGSGGSGLTDPRMTGNPEIAEVLPSWPPFVGNDPQTWVSSMRNNARSDEEYGKGMFEAISIYQDSSSIKSGLQDIRNQSTVYDGTYKVAMDDVMLFASKMTTRFSIDHERSIELVTDELTK